MSLTAWMRIAGIAAVLSAVVAIGLVWRSEMRDRAQLAGELAAAKQALDESQARQQDRDAKLAATLATLEAEKRSQQSPAELVKALVSAMRLPAAITLQTIPPAVQNAPSAQPPSVVPSTDVDSAAVGKPGAPLAKNAGDDLSGPKIQAVIPGQDLKPLYNFALECQECQSKLSASQGDLVDEKAKTKTLVKERDDALRVAHGGSVVVRIARASKWLVIGALAGAAAARAIH